MNIQWGEIKGCNLRGLQELERQQHRVKEKLEEEGVAAWPGGHRPLQMQLPVIKVSCNFEDSKSSFWPEV